MVCCLFRVTELLENVLKVYDQREAVPVPPRVVSVLFLTVDYSGSEEPISISSETAEVSEDSNQVVETATEDEEGAEVVVKVKAAAAPTATQSAEESKPRPAVAIDENNSRLLRLGPWYVDDLLTIRTIFREAKVSDFIP